MRLAWYTLDGTTWPYCVHVIPVPISRSPSIASEAIFGVCTSDLDVMRRNWMQSLGIKLRVPGFSCQCSATELQQPDNNQCLHTCTVFNVLSAHNVLSVHPLLQQKVMWKSSYIYIVSTHPLPQDCSLYQERQQQQAGRWQTFHM